MARRANIAADIAVRTAFTKAVTGRRPSRRKKIPPVPYPRSSELRYRKELLDYLDRASTYIDNTLMPVVDRALAEAGIELRRDSYIDTIVLGLEAARSVLAISDEAATELAETTARDVNQRNERGVQRQFVAAVGLELQGANQGLDPVIQGFVRENVTLIQSIPDQLMRDVERVIFTEVRKGSRSAEIARVLQERVGVAESRAKLIARDQVGKLNGNLTEERHRNVGIDSYVWDSSQDERVRPSHQVYHGNTYQYDEPPREGNPGQPIQCRCAAIPVVPEEFL